MRSRPSIPEKLKTLLYGGVAVNPRQMVVRAANALFAAALIFFCGAFVPRSRAQAQPQTQPQTQDGTAAPKYEYEVASIKLSKPADLNRMMIGIRNTQGGFDATGVNVRMLIKMAYNIQDNQLENAPSWIDSDRYDIDAKMDDDTAAALPKMSQDDRNAARQQMMQALLADRFKLTIHKDSKELPVYMLTIGKNGPKLKEATADEIAAAASRGGGGGRGGQFRMSMGPGSMSLTAQASTIEDMARMLSNVVGRTVIDKTGLTGRYDISLNWAPDDMGRGPMGMPPGGGAPPAPTDSNVPPLPTALQDLGLKLESGKGPAEIVVIDHIEKPSEN
jgi:uncharacterized protein (TIGR03435 family)